MRVRFRLLAVLLITISPALPALAAGPLVILIGTPAAGKTTQAGFLHREFGMTVISADDLIANNKDQFERYKKPTITGVEPRLDSALNALIEDAVKKADIDKGVVIDGYPSSKPQGDFLVGLRDKLKLPKALVIHLQIPDGEARKRLTQQKATDIDQQLKDYHREFDFAALYFPNTDIQTVDATKSPEMVTEEIRKLLAARGFSKSK
jgi:adenylate kinase